jgi:hypothetical protein
MASSAPESQENKHQILQKVESIEAILARDHTPEEVQEKITQLLEALEGGDLLAKKQIEVSILAQARERVKALLSHEGLEGKHHVEARGNLEKIKHMLHPMQAIAKMYDYSPHPETIDKVDLGIDWSGANVGVTSSNIRDFDTINESSEGVTTRGNERVQFFEKTLFESDVACSQDKPLKLKGEKSIRKVVENGSVTEQFILSLTNPNVPEEDFKHHCVGNFVFEKRDKGDHDEWDMNDRIVSEAYRNQGIAPKMLTMMEQMVGQYRETSNKPQSIVAEVGQVDVLIWLLKQGYAPGDSSDQEKIDRLLRGDESLTVVSAPDDAQEDEKRQWYIFEKSTYEGNEDKIWDRSNYGQPIHHMKSSLRIRLKKEII